MTNTWSNRDEVLNSLQEYCSLPSSSSDYEGVLEAQKHLIAILNSQGFKSKLIDNPLGKKVSAPLLHSKGGASSSSPKSAPRIAIISHADTLDGHEFEGRRFAITLTKEKIVGQGVLDDKASQYVALWGIQLFLKQTPQPKIGLDFISSPNEELGSQGFHPFYKTLAENVRMALGFEPSLADASIVSERRGNRWYEIEVTGREAHAGRGHKIGCNAAHELAIKISKLHRLTNYKKDVTLNIGQISSDSTTFNVVCGKATAKLDLRFSTIKARNEAHQSIKKILNKSFVKSKEEKIESKCSYSIVDDCPPLHQTRQSKKWVKAYKECIGEIEGKQPGDAKSGGGADVCYMANKNLIVIDGLGAIGANMHRNDEYALTASIESRARAFAAFLTKCNKDLK